MYVDHFLQFVCIALACFTVSANLCTQSAFMLFLCMKGYKLLRICIYETHKLTQTFGLILPDFYKYYGRVVHFFFSAKTFNEKIKYI